MKVCSRSGWSQRVGGLVALCVHIVRAASAFRERGGEAAGMTRLLLRLSPPYVPSFKFCESGVCFAFSDYCRLKADILRRIAIRPTNVCYGPLVDVQLPWWKLG